MELGSRVCTCFQKGGLWLWQGEQDAVVSALIGWMHQHFPSGGAVVETSLGRDAAVALSGEWSQQFGLQAATSPGFNGNEEFRAPP